MMFNIDSQCDYHLTELKRLQSEARRLFDIFSVEKNRLEKEGYTTDMVLDICRALYVNYMAAQKESVTYNETVVRAEIERCKKNTIIEQQ